MMFNRAEYWPRVERLWILQNLGSFLEDYVMHEHLLFQFYVALKMYSLHSKINVITFKNIDIYIYILKYD
jgi:hypothetical protein